MDLFTNFNYEIKTILVNPIVTKNNVIKLYFVSVGGLLFSFTLWFSNICEHLQSPYFR